MRDMTDNEIIKALELCATLDSGNCKKCPCREICNENDGTLTKLTLDLISRQKAEIERLQKKANTPFAKVTFDRDKLQEMVDECAKNIEIDINLAKSEAIKEFAERLKRYELSMYCSFPKTNIGSENYIVLSDSIDNLVKEMTEENENDRA